MDWLRDPIWQFIGVIVAILIPLAAFALQRNKKELTYEVISNTPILRSVGTHTTSKIQVTLNNRPVTKARILVVRVKNSGSASTRTSDFDQNNPIAFSFRPKAEILDAEIQDQTTLKQEVIFASPTYYPYIKLS